MYHACIVRSPHAAAHIKSVATESAREAGGVIAVFTGNDVAAVGPVPTGAQLPGLRVPVHKVLATDRVYYVGHPVAIVVATDKYIARDAADLIEVDYEPSPLSQIRKKHCSRILRGFILNTIPTSHSRITRKTGMSTKCLPRPMSS